VGGGRALACGFADGADTLQVVLALDTGAGVWRKVPLGAGVSDKTLQCVAAAADGTLMLGGVADAGGQAPRAFLWRRSAGGVWSEVALPDGDMIGGVNDVLPGPDGAWYVACGGEGGSGFAGIMRVDGGGAARDFTPFNGNLLQLAIDGHGDLYAVGYRLTPGGGLHEPVLLKRI
jgi:hypothetical protein